MNSRRVTNITSQVVDKLSLDNIPHARLAKILRKDLDMVNNYQFLAVDTIIDNTNRKKNSNAVAVDSIKGIYTKDDLMNLYENIDLPNMDSNEYLELSNQNRTYYLYKIPIDNDTNDLIKNIYFSHIVSDENNYNTKIRRHFTSTLVNHFIKSRERAARARSASIQTVQLLDTKMITTKLNTEITTNADFTKYILDKILLYRFGIPNAMGCGTTRPGGFPLYIPGVMLPFLSALSAGNRLFQVNEESKDMLAYEELKDLLLIDYSIKLKKLDQLQSNIRSNLPERKRTQLQKQINNLKGDPILKLGREIEYGGVSDAKIEKIMDMSNRATRHIISRSFEDHSRVVDNITAVYYSRCKLHNIIFEKFMKSSEVQPINKLNALENKELIISDTELHSVLLADVETNITADELRYMVCTIPFEYIINSIEKHMPQSITTYVQNVLKQLQKDGYVTQTNIEVRKNIKRSLIGKDEYSTDKIVGQVKYKNGVYRLGESIVKISGNRVTDTNGNFKGYVKRIQSQAQSESTDEEKTWNVYIRLNNKSMLMMLVSYFRLYIYQKNLPMNEQCNNSLDDIQEKMKHKTLIDKQRGVHMLKKLVYIFHFHRMMTEIEHPGKRGDRGGLIQSMLQHYTKSIYYYKNTNNKAKTNTLKTLGERISLYTDSLNSIVQYVPQMAYLRKTRARGHKGLRAVETDDTKPLRSGNNREVAMRKMFAKYKNKSTHKGNIRESNKLLNSLYNLSVSTYNELTDSDKKKVANAYYTLKNKESRIRQKTRLRKLISELQSNSVAFHKKNGVLKLKNEFNKNTNYLGFSVKAGNKPINIIKKRVDLGRRVMSNNRKGNARMRGRPKLQKYGKLTAEHRIASFRAGYDWAKKQRSNFNNYKPSTKSFLNSIRLQNNVLKIEGRSLLEMLKNNQESDKLLAQMVSAGREIAQHMVEVLFDTTKHKGIRLNELDGGKPGAIPQNNLNSYPESFTAELLKANKNKKISHPKYATDRYTIPRLSLLSNKNIKTITHNEAMKEVNNAVDAYLRNKLLRENNLTINNRADISQEDFKRAIRTHLQNKYNTDLINSYLMLPWLSATISDLIKIAFSKIKLTNIPENNKEEYVKKMLKSKGFDTTSIDKFLATKNFLNQNKSN